MLSSIKTTAIFEAADYGHDCPYVDPPHPHTGDYL